MNRNPDINPQTVLHELGRAGTAAREVARSAWEQTQQDLREEGHEKGREEAFVKALLLQTRARFDVTPSEHQMARINSASQEQICHWIEHCGSAQSLDDLLELEPSVHQ